MSASVMKGARWPPRMKSTSLNRWSPPPAWPGISDTAASAGTRRCPPAGRPRRRRPRRRCPAAPSWSTASPSSPACRSSTARPGAGPGCARRWRCGRASADHPPVDDGSPAQVGAQGQVDRVLQLRGHPQLRHGRARGVVDEGQGRKPLLKDVDGQAGAVQDLAVDDAAARPGGQALGGDAHAQDALPARSARR